MAAPSRLRSATAASRTSRTRGIERRIVGEPVAGVGEPQAGDAAAELGAGRGGAGPGSAMASKVRAASATVALSGPMSSRLGDSGNTPAAGTRPRVGFRPTTPHQAAGLRIEPPVSVPIEVRTQARGDRGGRARRRAAGDPLRVPGIDRRRRGPVERRADGGVFVGRELAEKDCAGARRRATTSASARAVGAGQARAAGGGQRRRCRPGPSPRPGCRGAARGRRPRRARGRPRPARSRRSGIDQGEGVERRVERRRCARDALSVEGDGGQAAVAQAGGGLGDGEVRCGHSRTPSRRPRRRRNRSRAAGGPRIRRSVARSLWMPSASPGRTSGGITTAPWRSAWTRSPGATSGRRR